MQFVVGRACRKMSGLGGLQSLSPFSLAAGNVIELVEALLSHSGYQPYGQQSLFSCITKHPYCVYWESARFCQLYL